MPARPQRLFVSLLYAVAFLALLLVHLPVLHTPYYWDELGQFAPAAFDIYDDGAWIPRSTLPNVHPPAVMAWVALAWQLGGFSIPVARIAMMIPGAAGLVLTFFLAGRLYPAAPKTAGIFASLLLFVCPLFWSQAALVQLDMPAMVFTTAALLLFLDDRWRAASLVCTVLVLVKETAIAVPAVLAAILICERRRAAAWFALPLFALGAWLIALHAHTGHWLGNSQFTEYNVWYPLHPVRLAGALLRRAYYLSIANFHWAGAAAIALACRAGYFRERTWRVTAVLFCVLVLSVTLAGGAALERYLLPALPLMYCAIAAAWCELRVRTFIPALVMTAVFACVLVNPPYPFPFENNFAWVDFVSVQREAAEFLDHEQPSARIATAWPFTDALRRAGFGYVAQPMRVRALSDLSRETLLRLKNERVDVIVLFSKTWDPEWGLLRHPTLERVLREFWGYTPDVSGSVVARELRLRLLRRWERRGQWIEAWTREPVAALAVSP